MKIKLLLLLSICLIGFSVYGQVDSAQPQAKEPLPKRYAFAKTYFGVDFNFTPSFGQSMYLNADGQLENFDRSGYITPHINIGATHFWGYADFYVSIGTANIKLGDDKVKVSPRAGTFTGFRIYPWKINDSNLRPFVGYKFSPFRYTQATLSDRSFKTTSSRGTLDLGVAYRSPKLYLYLAYNQLINPDTEVYVSRTQKVKTTYPNRFFTLGINWMMEATNYANRPVFKRMNDDFKGEISKGLFFGIGPSSAFPTTTSEYITTYYPFLNQFQQPAIFPDLSVGYHFTKPDIITALSFRFIPQTRKADKFELKITRTSLLLEAYKFVGDYHGFSPYIGGGVSYENLTLTESDNGIEIANIAQTKIVPVISTGWDIRPSRKGDYWILRTNVRYAPNLNLEHRNRKLNLELIEFNFIQFVFYPQRFKTYKKYLASKDFN